MASGSDPGSSFIRVISTQMTLGLVGGHQARVATRPVQGIRILDQSGRTNPVPIPSGREGHEHGLGGFRPVHGAAGENGEVVVIPQHAGTHGPHGIAPDGITVVVRKRTCAGTRRV